MEIIESAPRSKTKRWELVRILEKSKAVDIAALRTLDEGSTEASG